MGAVPFFSALAVCRGTHVNGFVGPGFAAANGDKFTRPADLSAVATPPMVANACTAGTVAWHLHCLSKSHERTTS